MKRSDIGTVSGFRSAGFTILESGVQEKFGIEAGIVFWGERSAIDFQAVVRGSRFEISRVEKEEWSLTLWQVGSNSERCGCLSLKYSVKLTMKAVVS